MKLLNASFAPPAAIVWLMHWLGQTVGATDLEGGGFVSSTSFAAEWTTSTGTPTWDATERAAKLDYDGIDFDLITKGTAFLTSGKRFEVKVEAKGSVAGMYLELPAAQSEAAVTTAYDWYTFEIGYGTFGEFNVAPGPASAVGTVFVRKISIMEI